MHEVIKLEEVNSGKVELSDPREFLQIMALNEPGDKYYPPHKHTWKEGGKTITQEAWVVVKGKMKGEYYDTDGTLLEEAILEPGDCSVTFYGGHALKILEEGTVFYEIKTGPYLGKEYDKASI